MRKPSPIIMSAVMVPKRPSKGRLARAFAHQQILRPNLTKALRSMGEARGFEVVGRELDLDIVGGIGTDPGRVSALDVEMRLAANPRVEKISINLNSPGGDVLQAQRIYNALRSHGAFVQVTVDQQCASAANQILLAGDLGRRGSARKSSCIQPKSGRRRARD